MARVRLTNGFEVTSYIGGEGHNLAGALVFVLISRGRVQDLAGLCVLHTVARQSGYRWREVDRPQGRSKYWRQAPQDH